MSTLFLGYDQELLWSLRKIRQKKAKTKRHLLLSPLRKKLARIRLLVTSVKDHVCECTRLGLGLLSTSRTYLPQVGGAKLSMSNTSPALNDDGLTDGGLEPS